MRDRTRSSCCTTSLCWILADKSTALDTADTPPLSRCLASGCTSRRHKDWETQSPRGSSCRIGKSSTQPMLPRLTTHCSVPRDKVSGHNNTITTTPASDQSGHPAKMTIESQQHTHSCHGPIATQPLFNTIQYHTPSACKNTLAARAASLARQHAAASVKNVHTPHSPFPYHVRRARHAVATRLTYVAAIADSTSLGQVERTYTKHKHKQSTTPLLSRLNDTKNPTHDSDTTRL